MSNYKNTVASGAGDSDAVILKWADNTTLLVGSSAAFKFDSSASLADFQGITIDYFSYPNSTDEFEDPIKRVIVTKSLDFDAHFEPFDNIGSYGAGCTLRMSADDGAAFGRIALSFHATEELPKSGGFEGVRVIPAGGTFIFVRVGLDSGILPVNVTAVALDGVATTTNLLTTGFDDAPARWSRENGKVQVEWKLPSGRFSALVNNIKAGMFELKVANVLRKHRIRVFSSEPHRYQRAR